MPFKSLKDETPILPESPLISSLTEDQASLVRQLKMSAMGQMASSISHEINNPLTVIRMNAEILISYIERGEPSDKILEKCKKIINTTERIDNIVRSLRSLSSEQSQPLREWTLVSQLIEGAVDVCAHRFQSEGVELRLNILVDSDYKTFVDPAQISQALINLIQNSLDAISQNEERWIQIHAKEMDGKMIFIVQDSGLGIKDDVIKSMFSPFFSTKKNASLGLGLNLTRSYVTYHNGIIYYKLINGHTSFVIEVPIESNDC